MASSEDFAVEEGHEDAEAGDEGGPGEAGGAVGDEFADFEPPDSSREEAEDSEDGVLDVDEVGGVLGDGEGGVGVAEEEEAAEDHDDGEGGAEWAVRGFPVAIAPSHPGHGKDHDSSELVFKDGGVGDGLERGHAAEDPDFRVARDGDEGSEGDQEEGPGTSGPGSDGPAGSGDLDEPAQSEGDDCHAGPVVGKLCVAEVIDGSGGSADEPGWIDDLGGWEVG